MERSLGGWRRIMGLPQLIVSVALFVGAIRSYFMFDRCFFRIGGVKHVVTSSDGWLSWHTRAAELWEGMSGISVPGWVAMSAAAVRELPISENHLTWSVPHLAIGLPLSIVATVLLLSKRPNSQAASFPR